LTGTRRKTNDAPPEDLAAPAEDLLNTSPFDGDLSEELDAAPKPRRRLPSVTVFLGAGVLIVGGFVGGVQADRHWGAKPSSNASDLLSQFARRAGQNGGGLGVGALGGGQTGGGRQGTGTGQGQGGGSGTTGTVKLVDGSTIWVQTPNGLVRVKTTGSTKVTVAKKSTAKALKAGSPVTVQGSTGQDGTVTATSVKQGG
jgi:hypothetical protein